MFLINTKLQHTCILVFKSLLTEMSEVLKHRPICFETKLSGNKVSKHRMKVSKHTSHVSKHTAFPAVHALRDSIETAMSGRQKIFSTMIIHVLHFKFEFEFLESMENAFNKMIEKLLNRNKNAKQKVSRISKKLLIESEISKHNTTSFET